MYCTKCGVKLRDDADRFCSQCGHRTAVGVEEAPARALMLDRRNKKVAGVCAGFARYLGEDVTLIRVLWLALSVATGVGFLAYFVAWIIMPSDRADEFRATTAPAPQAG